MQRKYAMKSSLLFIITFSILWTRKLKFCTYFPINVFLKTKNKYLWNFYKFLISCGILDQIMIYYPIPGHSFMEIDGDFGRIELNKKN